VPLPGATVERFAAGDAQDLVVGPDIALGKPTLTASRNRDERPTVVSRGDHPLVVWRSSAYGLNPLVGAFLDPAGQPPAKKPTAFGDSWGVSVDGGAAMAWNGSRYLVVGMNYGQLRGVLVGSAGAALGSSFDIATLSPDASPPAVAASNDSFLVVWSEPKDGVLRDVFGARIGADGAVLDPAGIPISTAANDQSEPDVDWDGQHFVVTWRDYRSGSDDIYAARVDPKTGAVLDPDGIAVSTAPGGQTQPRIAFDGTNHLLVWRDTRKGGYDIYGARLSPAASVLDPAGIPISTAPGAQRAPALAWNGQSFVAVWEDRPAGASYDLRGARISPEGTVLDAAGFSIASTSVDETAPAIDCNGPICNVAFQADSGFFGGEIMTTRLDASGAVLDASQVLLSLAYDNQIASDAASDGKNFLALLYDDRSPGGGLLAARVTPGGAVLDDPPRLIAPFLFSYTPIYAPGKVAFDGTNYLAVWSQPQSDEPNQDDLYGVDVSPAGEMVGAPFPIATGPGSQDIAVIAGSGGQSMLAWTDRAPDYSTTTMRIARIGAGGTVLPPGGTAIGDQLFPASIAFDGKSFLLVVVAYDMDGNASLLAMRVSPDGMVLDPGGFALPTVTGGMPFVAVASDGEGFFVVYADNHYYDGTAGKLYGTRVSSAGKVLDPDGLLLDDTVPASDQYANLAAVFDGEAYVVSYLQQQGGSLYKARAMRVSTQGAVLEAATDAAPFPGYQAPMASDGAGHTFLVYDMTDQTTISERTFARILTPSSGSGGGSGSGSGSGSGGGGGSGGDSGNGSGGGDGTLEGGQCGCREAGRADAGSGWVLGLGLMGLLQWRRARRAALTRMRSAAHGHLSACR
jgi:hypothetical protein